MSQLGQDDYPVVAILGQEENAVFSAHFTGTFDSLYHPSHKNHQERKSVQFTWWLVPDYMYCWWF